MYTHSILCCSVYKPNAVTVCLKLLDGRVAALEALINTLGESVPSSDDQFSSLLTKYKAVRAAVHVSLFTCV